jgi:hypothetical protein
LKHIVIAGPDPAIHPSGMARKPAGGSVSRRSQSTGNRSRSRVAVFDIAYPLDRTAREFPHHVERDPKNPEVFSGRYVEVNPPSRLVLTQVYERMSDVGEAVVTATFEESQGRTRLTLHQLVPSKEALEGALAAGMEPGMRVTLDQLDALVASTR